MNKPEYSDFIVRLIAQVQHAIERPNMYLGYPSVAAAQGFSAGIHCAIIAAGGILTHELRREATESRGWQFTSTGGLDLMRKRKLSEEQIAEEMLHIEIALLKLVTQNTTDAA